MNFPSINYKYWINKNPYFSNQPLIATIVTGLRTSSKGGLIAPALGFDQGDITNDMLINAIPTNAFLIQIISEKIKNYCKSNNNQDDDLLLIFDLIQGWGGKMGRAPYVRPKESPSRLFKRDELLNLYKNGVACCFQGDYVGAVSAITSISNIGESFATKHIFFWTKYGPQEEAMPIYDTRIKNLLCLHNSPPVYEVYVQKLMEKSNLLQLEPEEVERALFSFSQNYFKNGEIIISNKISDWTDKEIAQNLESEWCAKK